MIVVVHFPTLSIVHLAACASRSKNTDEVPVCFLSSCIIIYGSVQTPRRPRASQPWAYRVNALSRHTRLVLSVGGFHEKSTIGPGVVATLMSVNLPFSLLRSWPAGNCDMARSESVIAAIDRFWRPSIVSSADFAYPERDHIQWPE